MFLEFSLVGLISCLVLKSAASNILVYGEIETDNRNSFESIYGLYEIASFENKSYIQIIPNYFEDPYLILQTGMIWYIAKNSTVYKSSFKSIVSSKLQNEEAFLESDSPIGHKVHVLINQDFELVNATLVSCENITFTEFGGASFTYVPLKKDFDESQKICHALDGSLPFPTTSDALQFLINFLPSDVYQYWTGFYRSNNSAPWKWSVNDGSGNEFIYSTLDVAKTGCVVHFKNGTLKTLNCSETLSIICQTNQYYYNRDKWNRFYSIKRSFGFARSFCSQRENKESHLLRTYDREFLSRYLTTFNLTEDYWLNVIFNPQTSKFEDEYGLEVVGKDWAPGNPNHTAGHCVVLQKDHLWKSVTCDRKSAVACQYRPTNVSGQFRYQDRWIWLSEVSATKQEAVEICGQNNHEALVVDDPDLLSILYAQIYTSDKNVTTMWIDFGPNLNSFYILFKLNQSDEACVLVNSQDINFFQNVSCQSTASFACISRNIFGFTKKVDSFCPKGYRNMGGVTCLAEVDVPSSWPVAYETCMSAESSLVGLEDFSIKWSMPILHLFMHVENVSGSWTGMCKQVYEEFSNADTGTCAYATGIDIVSVDIGSLWYPSFYLYKYFKPFVCQTKPLHKNPENNYDFNDLVKTAFSNTINCASNPGSSRTDVCFFYDYQFTNWEESCSRYSLLSYDSNEVHARLTKLMTIYKWFSKARAWIGLKVVNMQPIWSDGINRSFAAWPTSNLDVMGTFCVSINETGFWNLENCSIGLPSFCKKFDQADAQNYKPITDITSTILETSANSNRNLPTTVIPDKITEDMSPFVATTTRLETSANLNRNLATKVKPDLDSILTTPSSTEIPENSPYINKQNEQTMITNSFSETTAKPIVVEEPYCYSEKNCTLCPLTGEWSSWLPQHRCSKTCGNGSRILYRICNCPISNYIAEDCEGNSTMVEECSDQECPVNGGWSEWSDWKINRIELCKITKHSRTRNCSSPYPSGGGLFCDGTTANTADKKVVQFISCFLFPKLIYEMRSKLKKRGKLSGWAFFLELQETEEKLNIKVVPCPEHYSWGSWLLFTPCSATCGDGAKRSRKRNCEWNDEEYYKIEECPHEEEQSLQCGFLDCPIDGHWSNWTSWSSCSVSCGQGIQFRFRLCNDPAPAYYGKDCERSSTGSDYEQQPCKVEECPLERYQASQNNFPHCPEERSKETSILWEVAYSGTVQNQPCPPGTTGTATRKCSQQQAWLKEDLSDCVVTSIAKFANISKSSIKSKEKFEEVITGLGMILSADKYQNNLRSNGDLMAIPDIIKRLMKWNPFQFKNRTLSSRLEYVGIVTSLVSDVLNSKYSFLWKDMNITSKLKTFQSYLSLIDEMNLAASQKLDYLSYSKYETSLSDDLNAMITILPGWDRSMRYPDERSPQTKLDESYIEMRDDTLSVPPNATMRVTFTKYDDPNGMLSSLLLTSLPHKNQPSFSGRKLNSAVLGVQAAVDGESDKEHRLNGHVYIKFFHKRASRDHICAFIDLKSNDGIFNSDGCEIWRERESWTMCRCNHLTNFALLSHDIYNEELWWRNTLFSFRSMLSGVNFFCIAVLLVVFALIFYPHNKVVKRGTLAFSLVFAVLLRYSVVQMILWFSTSQLLCLASSSLLTYFTTLCCLCHACRILSVYVKTASTQTIRKSNGGILAWGLSILAPATVVSLYFLYDFDHQGELRDNLDCRTLFSLEVFYPNYAICSFLIVYSWIMLFVVIGKFRKVKKNKKPIDAYRNEKEIWLKGFSCLFGYAIVVVTFVVFVNLDLPLFSVQILYVVLAIFEVLSLFATEVWMNHDIRSFYYQFFRAKPPVESVMFKPPVYIP